MNQQQYQGGPQPPRMSGGRSSPSYTQRINQRMTREEAVKGAVRMLTAYTTLKATEESILVLSEVLMQFPLETAMAASSPVHGAPKQYRDFPINAGQLTDWCELNAEHLYEQARMERPRLAAPQIDRSARLSLDELRARHGPNWGLQPMEKPSKPKWIGPTDDELRSRYARAAE